MDTNDRKEDLCENKFWNVNENEGAKDAEMPHQLTTETKDSTDLLHSKIKKPTVLTQKDDQVMDVEPNTQLSTSESTIEYKNIGEVKRTYEIVKKKKRKEMFGEEEMLALNELRKKVLLNREKDKQVKLLELNPDDSDNPLNSRIPDLLQLIPDSGNNSGDITKIFPVRDVNIFDIEFLIIPINMYNHWCVFLAHNLKNLQYVGRSRPIDVANNWSRYCPKIVMFDSSKKGHIPTGKIYTLFRNYVQLEFEDKFQRKITIDCENLPDAFTEVPRQTNLSDCGIHTLHNIEVVLRLLPWNDDIFEDISSYYGKYPIKNKRFKILKTFYNWIDYQLTDGNISDPEDSDTDSDADNQQKIYIFNM